MSRMPQCIVSMVLILGATAWALRRQCAFRVPHGRLSGQDTDSKGGGFKHICSARLFGYQLGHYNQGNARRWDMTGKEFARLCMEYQLSHVEDFQKDPPRAFAAMLMSLVRVGHITGDEAIAVAHTAPEAFREWAVMRN